MTNLPKLFVNQKVVKAVIVYKEVHDAKTRAKIIKYFQKKQPLKSLEEIGECIHWGLK